MTHSTGLSQGESATVHGGKARVNTDVLTTARIRLSSVADELDALKAHGYAQCSTAQSHLFPIKICPGAYSPDASTHAQHVRCVGYEQRLENDLHQIQWDLDRFTVLSKQCREMADLLARAVGVYNESESTIFNLFSNLLGFSCDPFKLANLFLLPSIIGMGGLSGKFSNGNPWRGWQQLLTFADPFMQPGMNDLAHGLGGRTPNDIAHRLAPLAAHFEELIQGTHLTVTRSHPSHGRGLGPAPNISSALKNLDCLGNPACSGLPYSTIACEQHRESNGHQNWTIYIPGTRNETDSPIGWGQNIELMSSNSSERLNADSVQLVLEALRRAGVKKGDTIVLVGHSQGGIVAASIAAAAKQLGLNVSHVVTAGSPIANHDLSGTYGTSIETEGETVSRLDGRDNPSTDKWTTVRGKLNSSTTGPARGSKVESTGGKPALTHGMNYHRAAWKDAMELGNPAAIESDRHFRESVKGTYIGTQYFTGRMSKEDDEKKKPKSSKGKHTKSKKK